MDDNIFSSRHYKINQISMRVLGIWPEQSSIARIFLPSCFLLLNVSLYIPQLRQLSNFWGDIDRMMEVITSCGVMTASTIMMVNSIMKNEEILGLVNRIRRDWQKSTNPELLTILNLYANSGRRRTIIHTLMMYGGGVVFFSLPLSPMVLNAIVPLNESRPKKYLYSVDYGVNNEEHYYSILLHSWVVTFSCMSIFVGIDSIFAVWVQHCCALFEISGFYLKNKLRNVDTHRGDGEKSQICEETVRTNLRSCINQHQVALRFADQIESVYSIVQAAEMGISVMLMSVSGLLLVVKLNNIDDAVRYSTVVVCVLYRLHHQTVSGQDMINHSSRISEYAYGCDWHKFPLKTQKLMMLIMIRAQRPCALTAGKIYVINMENFSEIVKTSVSYFTVLSSVRETSPPS
ncbi:odorant receptor Or2-like [Venturia canescens]|uniref:odorant receptor Or2-like n=1 Tax=Venturia canescens TaxID=32260 RepID=UPI001C9BC1CA|nr:odorant receptor Or2-like [Venturia canescens]